MITSSGFQEEILLKVIGIFRLMGGPRNARSVRGFHGVQPQHQPVLRHQTRRRDASHWGRHHLQFFQHRQFTQIQR